MSYIVCAVAGAGCAAGFRPKNLFRFNVLDAVWTVKCVADNPLLVRCVFLRAGLDAGVGL